MKRYIIWTIFLCTIQGVFAQESHIPFRDVEAVEDGIIVTYHFNGASIISNPTFPNTYLWKIPNFGINDVEGEPATPFRWDIFTIPPSLGFEVELLDSAYNDTILALSPAMSPDTENTISSIPKKGIRPYQGFFPEETLFPDNSQYCDGYNLLKICVQPVKYDYEHHIIRHYSYVKYKVRYVTDNQKRGILNTVNSINPILENISLNYQTLPSVIKTKALKSSASLASLETNRHLLIITTPTFAAAVNRFSKWKRTKGWNVHIEMSNAWTVNSVKSTVQNVYATTNNTLKYLLIVGDVEFVPSQICTYRHSHATDLYYGCINNSYLPEIHRGRISVKTNAEADSVFNKIMRYECSPTTDVSFYKKALHCAHFESSNGVSESSRFVRTSEEIRNALLGHGKIINREYSLQTGVTPTYWSSYYADGTEIPDSLQLGNFEWNGNATGITNCINDGTFYVLHRNHGEIEGWVHPLYEKNDLQMLVNDSKWPVVFSINCLSGKFNHNTDCFAEAFLKKSDGGCVGIFAATERSLKGYNDALSEGMFNAIWPELDLRPFFPGISYANITPITTPIYELGAMLDCGMLRMEETYGTKDQNDMIYTREIFHCLGDPTMNIYTATPQNIAPPTISKSGNTIRVQTNDGNARIVFYNPLTENVLSYDGTDAQISTDADSLIICVDRHNYVPYIQKYYKNLYIQNETINGTQSYLGNNIKVGESVTTTQPTGPVTIQNANVKMKATTIELHSGTTITNSSVEIDGYD